MADPLVLGEAAEADDRAGRDGGRRIPELYLVDAILDHRQPRPGASPKHIGIAIATGDDAAIGADRRPGDAVKPDLLGSVILPAVEEAAMGRGDHRPPMQWLRCGEKVEEEVDGMEMQNIGGPQMG